MGTTLGKKEEVNLSVKAKKPAAIKRATKKVVVGKKVASAKAKSTAKPLTKKAPGRTKKLTEPKATTAPEVVFVPGAASVRLLEKVQLYTAWYEQRVPVTMSVMAKVGGYAFIFLGAVFAVYSYIDVKSVISTPAALVCSEAVCTNIKDTELPATAPKITFLNSVPTTLVTDTDFKISTQQAIDPTITLTAIETGGTVELKPVEKLNETDYRFMLPASRLGAATYTITASTKQHGSTYTFTGPTFTVPLNESDTDQAVEVVPVENEEVVDINEETASTTSLIEAGDDTDTKTVTDNSTETSEAELPITTGSLTPITVTLHQQNQAEYLKIKTGDFTPSAVEVYSKSVAGDQSLYLGQATLVQGEWVFSVSARSLPQVTHSLYASFMVAGKTYQSEAVVYAPAKTTLSTPVTETDLAILVQKIELALLASSVNNDNRQHYFNFFTAQPESLFSASDELRFADRTLLEAIDSALLTNVESLNALLLRYAAAVQAESDFLVSLSSEALTDNYTKLASTIASTIAEPAAVPAIHTVLALRYQILKDKIHESEDQIKQDTNNLTAKDGDQDGISDFDEVANFGTNPLLADTDQDGVLDSVELVRNSNPLLAEAMAIPTLNKNIEDLTFDAVVEINFVGPEVVSTQDNTTEEYFIRVEGRSVPNSHVYLLSRTNAVIGVVQTGATGLFSYTFEKDFAIGEHEVVAVLVDAAGEIVASSKPQRFTRTANAFVAAAALSTTAGSNTWPAQDNVLLNLLVAAVGVITFGFVLLLLSSTLRNHRPQKTKLA